MAKFHKAEPKTDKKCSKNRCKNLAASARAAFCSSCFRKNAAVANLKRKVRKGNTQKGRQKRAAGKRSGLKRATKDLLLIKALWLQMILRKRKTWEFRGSSTSKRGLIHLSLSGSGGEIHGRARVTDCRLLTRKELRRHKNKHCINDIDKIEYARIFAWILSDVRRYKKPLRYTHKQGAMI